MSRPARRAPLRALVSMLAAVVADPGHAFEIYKWTDEKGVVHYSESRPEQVPAAVETLYIPATNPPGYDPSEDYWSVVKQAERISEQWETLEQEREEEEARERALAAEQRVAELEQRLAAAEDVAYDAGPVYARYAWFPAHRPGVFHRHVRHRLPGRRPPPRRGAANDGPRPAWPGPDAPSDPGPAVPGFAAPDGR